MSNRIRLLNRRLGDVLERCINEGNKGCDAVVVVVVVVVVLYSSGVHSRPRHNQQLLPAAKSQFPSHASTPPASTNPVAHTTHSHFPFRLFTLLHPSSPRRKSTTNPSKICLIQNHM